MTKSVKIPKKIAGVKLPKQARKTANKAIKRGLYRWWWVLPGPSMANSNASWYRVTRIFSAIRN